MSGLHEPAVRERAVGQTRAAPHESRAFFLRDVEVVQVALEFLLVHRRPHLDAGREAVPDFESAGLGGEFFSECFEDAPFDEDAETTPSETTVRRGRGGAGGLWPPIAGSRAR